MPLWHFYYNNESNSLGTSPISSGVGVFWIIFCSLALSILGLNPSILSTSGEEIKRFDSMVNATTKIANVQVAFSSKSFVFWTPINWFELFPPNCEERPPPFEFCTNTTIIRSTETKIIKPTIKNLNKSNYKVSGPFAADTIFLKNNRKKYNVIIGMYHDQVLTPIKTLFEYDAINITLGLPFIRISPDHGPNDKMLGKNKSNPLSLVNALTFLDSKKWSKQKKV